jgi:large subunit ribosomal protein L1
MTAKKAELFEELKKLNKKTTLTLRNTIAEITAEIKKATDVIKPMAADVSTTKAKTAAESEAKTTDTAPKAGEKSTDAAETADTFAKAGKRSKKAVEEVKAKLEKEELKSAQKVADSDDSEVKKGPRPVTRPLIERRGKKYQAAAKKIETGKAYSLSEATALAADTNPSKFDASVEVHVRLGVDPRQSDQNIRATVSLPHGSGKTVRVAVFASEADAKTALQAGADLAGDEELLHQLSKEQIGFDTLIATPTYMPKLSKFARLLGPKGLMPNPKAGTVTTNIKQAVTEAKAGKVEYRVDKQAIIHISIGKTSFGAKKLAENTNAFLDSLKNQKPASLKGVFVKSVYLATTQGPSIKVAIDL